jgi:RNA polymerase sigma-70 factor (ECF subfamily)
VRAAFGRRAAADHSVIRLTVGRRRTEVTVTETCPGPTVALVGVDAGSDELLVPRLCAGDDRALGIAYDRHADVVFGIARRVTSNDDLAREVTQEVFVHLWRFPDRVDLTRGTLRAYLAVVSHHRAVDAVRSHVRRHRSETRASAASVCCDDGQESAVVDGFDRTWRRDRVAALLDRLPEEQRAAVTLAFVDGCTSVEVARRLGIPEGTAKSRIRLALSRLRLLLADESWVVT